MRAFRGLRRHGNSRGRANRRLRGFEFLPQFQLRLEPLCQGLEPGRLFGLQLAHLLEEGLLGRGVPALFGLAETLQQVILPGLERLGGRPKLLERGLAQPGGTFVEAEGLGVAQGLAQPGHGFLHVGIRSGTGHRRRLSHFGEGTGQVVWQRRFPRRIELGEYLLSGRSLEDHTQKGRCASFQMKRADAGAGGCVLVFRRAHLVPSDADPWRCGGQLAQQGLHPPREGTVILRDGRVIDSHVEMECDRLAQRIQHGVDRWRQGNGFFGAVAVGAGCGLPQSDSHEHAREEGDAHLEGASGSAGEHRSGVRWAARWLGRVSRLRCHEVTLGCAPKGSRALIATRAAERTGGARTIGLAEVPAEVEDGRMPVWRSLGWILLVVGRMGTAAGAWEDRFVWVFGWNLERAQDLSEVVGVLQDAGRNGFNGAVVSFGLDTLCRRSPAFFERLQVVRRVCATNGLELIPAVFSIGYGGGFLAHDPHLAEGLPVKDALFGVEGGVARFVPEEIGGLRNGGFEEHRGNRFEHYTFHDQPGEVSFADTNVVHGGRVSIRLENFRSNPHGHGRVMQEVSIRPYRCYRVSLWVRTEGLDPSSAFRCLVLAGERELAPRTFRLRSGGQWQKIQFLFNSLEHDRVRLYAGVWGGRAGRVWLDDWTLEEAGPVNVLRRPGTPVTVRSETEGRVYEEGRDYAPLESPDFNPWRGDGTAAELKLLPGGRIRDGERLRVSWYHPMLIHESQVTVCMAESRLDEILDHEARLLAEHLRPRRVFLNMDEVRMGGTCAACAGRDMARLLGECVQREVAALRRYLPDVQVYVWSDMFDPQHNARSNYYLVRGDFTGSWRHVPRDLVMAVWGGTPRPESLAFFAREGFTMLVACYYDAEDLEDVARWRDVVRGRPQVRGFMYTPWTRKYGLLPEFARLLGFSARSGREPDAGQARDARGRDRDL
ncbi:MAG: hypothetical protein KatS3mg132_159 [Limisphaera sp.]|nr:MAG: hypothetical protein KatS3mg132_159 [Limisphaera sp.]